MTGCPNGCARPYNAEIGIVGRTKKGYDVYVGGSATGDRMGERIRTDVPIDQLAATLAPVFAQYAARTDQAATFGDWSHGVGTETITTWLPEPVVARAAARGRRHRGDHDGVVALVGAGPGDPDLLTVRAGAAAEPGRRRRPRRARRRRRARARAADGRADRRRQAARPARCPRS